MNCERLGTEPNDSVSINIFSRFKKPDLFPFFCTFYKYQQIKINIFNSMYKYCRINKKRPIENTLKTQNVLLLFLNIVAL